MTEPQHDSSQPWAIRNGVFVPVSQLSVPVYDAGFVQGTTVAEQLRTFHGQLFRLDEHLDRLFDGLQCVGVTLSATREQLKSWAIDLAVRNRKALHAEDDLALAMFVTPGPYAAFAAAPGIVPEEDRGPLLAMHTYPIPFKNWASLYDQGQRLIISSVREVPRSCWPAALKCRSRMHYHLADLEVRRQDPVARALLLDTDGNVAEATTASVFVFHRGEGFAAPPEESVLPSISLRTIRETAARLGIRFTHRIVEPAELFDADEILLCSTSPCVLPVTKIDGRTVSDGKPGPMWRTLMAAWNETAGFDLVAQAKQFASR